jgi:hypothetical protein
VSLARQVPVGLSDSHRSGFVFLDDSPSEPSSANGSELLEEVLRVAATHWPGSLRESTVSSESAWSLWKRRRTVNQKAVVAIASPFSVPPYINGLYPQILEQLAAGLRVLTGSNPDLVNAIDGNSVVVVDPDAVDAQVEKTLGEGLPSTAVRWSVLRTLYTDHATPVMLAALVRQLGLQPNPLLTRSVTVIAQLTGDTAHTLFDALQLQSVQPAQLIANLPDGDSLPDSVGTGLKSAGIAVSVTRGQHRRAELLSYVNTPWITFWDGRSWTADRLLDLLLAAECAHVDAVGFGGDELMRYVQSLPSTGTLLRTDSAAVDGVDIPELDSWALRGRRMCVVGIRDGN